MATVYLAEDVRHRRKVAVRTCRSWCGGRREWDPGRASPPNGSGNEPTHGYLSRMIRDSSRLREFEASFQRQQLTLSYSEALDRFAALWAEARLLRPDLGADWEADLEPDLAIARTLNGLPSTG